MKKEFCLILAVSVLVVLAGCATTSTLTKKAAYPTLDDNEASSVLVLNNQIKGSVFWGLPFLSVTIDGFSPTQYLYLPVGQTKIRIPPGSHEITHIPLVKGSQLSFNPVTTIFDTKKGETYEITFKYRRSINRPVCLIEYKGWSDEEVSQWPTKNETTKAVFW